MEFFLFCNCRKREPYGHQMRNPGFRSMFLGKENVRWTEGAESMNVQIHAGRLIRNSKYLHSELLKQLLTLLIFIIPGRI
jgi:hypothetical protein